MLNQNEAPEGYVATEPKYPLAKCFECAFFDKPTTLPYEGNTHAMCQPSMRKDKTNVVFKEQEVASAQPE